MPICRACGQERERPEPFVSTWKTQIFEGAGAVWLNTVVAGAGNRHLVLPANSFDAHKVPPGTTVTIRAEFKLP